MIVQHWRMAVKGQAIAHSPALRIPSLRAVGTSTKSISRVPVRGLGVPFMLTRFLAVA